MPVLIAAALVAAATPWGSPQAASALPAAAEVPPWYDALDEVIIAVPRASQDGPPTRPSTDPAPDGSSDPPNPAQAIRPGDRTMMGCTLGFFYQSTVNDTVYASTAGHCVEDGVGAEWALADGRSLGVLVAYEDGGEGNTSSYQDWALIRVYDEVRDAVSPSVRHWTGPTGVARNERVAYNDLVCYYGQGDVFRESEATRHRCARFEHYYHVARGPGTVHFNFFGPMYYGDSGGPILHYETGRALGHVFGGIPPVWHTAPTICTLLDLFDMAGYPVQLMTAPYDPPLWDPTSPVGVPTGPVTEPHDGACRPD